MKKYLYCYIKDYNLNNETINLLSDFDVINLFSLNLIKYDFNNSKEVYYYCFNEEQINYCKKMNYKIHLCLTTNTLNLISFYNQDMELFYFPSKDDLEINDDLFINKFSFLTKYTVCIFTLKDYADVFLYGNEFLKFYKKIKSTYGNLKILDLEEKLLDSEYSEYNNYLIQKNDMIENGKLVLGMISDVKTNQNFEKVNKQKLLKNKQCIGCDYLNNCIKRGNGVVMDSFNTIECVGIKLLKD